jgi:cell shape-determining protein MreC
MDEWTQKVDFVSATYTRMLVRCDESIKIPHMLLRDQGHVTRRTPGKELLGLLHVCCSIFFHLNSRNTNSASVLLQIRLSSSFSRI